MSENQPGEGTPNTPSGPEGGDGAEQTFTQADVDKLVGKARTEERRKAGEKYADYDDLKAKAGKSTTDAERIAALEGEVQATKHEALRRRVQAAHGISDDDADLFLTGSDEAALTAQATRLAAHEAKAGTTVRREGANPPAKANDERTFVRDLFAG